VSVQRPGAPPDQPALAPSHAARDDRRPLPAGHVGWDGGLALAAAPAAGAATMIVELAVGRILAPQLGVSIHTWSALIGFVLAGLAIGGWAGGRLADRSEPRLALGGALALAAAATFASLPLASLPPPGWLGAADVLGRMVWQTGLLVLAPSLALGAVLPAAARLLVREPATVGRRLGLLYALGTAGSIGGTLLTGFVLIDRVGSRPSVALAGGALGLLALLTLARAAGRAAVALRLTAAAAPALALVFPSALAGPCTLESAYVCIQIQARHSGPVELRAMLLDKLLHSYGAPDDPTHLEYGYTRDFALVARVHGEGRPPPRALFVGGGGYTVPRYLEATYPGAEIDVIEIDPKVTLAAERYLGLSPGTRIRTFNEDARQFFIQRRTPGDYDLVFGDAFNDLSIPYHLTTREFATAVRGSLASDGLYVANVIDLFPAGDFLRAYLATLRSVFPHVAILLEPQLSADSPWGDGPVTTRRERATFVIVASAAPLPLDRLARAPGAPAVVLAAERFQTLVGGRDAIVLTDDYAPVDALTGRLFLARYAG
jgi:predicted membrane-bound spermidine synthase